MRRFWLVLAMLALVVAMALPAMAQPDEYSNYEGKGVYGDDGSSYDDGDSYNDSPEDPECGWYFSSESRDEWWEYWCWWPGWGWEFVFWVWA